MNSQGHVFAAMADPTRRAILSVVSAHDGIAVGDIAREFPLITRGAVSAHLRVLRSADLVSEERQGQFRMYRLGPNRAEEVVQYLLEVYAEGLDQFLRANS